jgi:hypothetical protein
MTISSETRKAGPFDGNDVTTSFPFTFKTFEKADVKVIYTDVDEIESVLVLDSDYTVTLNLDQNASPGGSISYSTLATGEKLTILGDVEYTQETDIQNQGGFYPEVFENALDKITMLIQQVKEISDRAVVVPASSSVTSENYLNTINAYRVEAASSASSSSAFASSALASSNTAESILQDFETKYLGAKASDPTLDNEGNALINGALYFNTTLNAIKAYILNTTTWALIKPTDTEQDDINTIAAISADVSTVADVATDVVNFSNTYLGAKSANPTLDNQGNALIDGALYFNTTDNDMRVYDLATTTWLTAYSEIIVQDESITEPKLAQDIFNALTTVTIQSTDYVAIADGSDDGNKKKALVSDIVSLVPPTTGSLIGLQVFTSSGTYDKATNNPSFVIVEVQAAGGSGGGASTTGTTSSGGGGGGGGYALKKILSSSLSSSETVTVGSGKTGTTGNGTTGDASSFGSHCSATGGGGGARGLNGTNGGGVDGGIGIGGDINIYGDSGQRAEATGISGFGGGSKFSGIARAVDGVGEVGKSALDNSGGGGSGASATSAATRVGGNSGSGIVIVWEYK